MNYFAAKSYILHRLAAELPPFHTYHSVHHTRDVLTCTLDLAQREGLKQYEKLLVATAAAFHDAGFLIRWQNHEANSCCLVREVLPEFSYVPEEIDQICDMIMSTRIPQSPRNKLEEILCDADLDYLGRPDFLNIGRTLYQELRHQELIRTEEEWNKLQISFLEDHRYFTATSIKRRQASKKRHLRSLKASFETGKGR